MRGHRLIPFITAVVGRRRRLSTNALSFRHNITMTNVTLKVEATEQSVLDFIDQLPSDLRTRALELFVFEDVVRAADAQLKR